MIGIPLATIHSYFVADAPGFLYPEFARIFFWHFPCPVLATGCLTAGLYFSLRYSSSRDLKWDVRATAAHELAFVFIAMTMITGIFFSRIQWNAWWQNDPRQVSFLLVMTIYAAYFALRAAFIDQEKRALNSSGFAMAAYLPFLYLTFVYPRLPQVINNHPNDSIMGGNIKGGYAYVTIELIFLISLVTIWAYKLRSRAGILELETENYGDLENSRRSAADPVVVRPLSLSDEGG
jgi:heme exporter protein C